VVDFGLIFVEAVDFNLELCEFLLYAHDVLLYKLVRDDPEIPDSVYFPLRVDNFFISKTPNKMVDAIHLLDVAQEFVAQTLS